MSPTLNRFSHDKELLTTLEADLDLAFLISL